MTEAPSSAGTTVDPVFSTFGEAPVWASTSDRVAIIMRTKDRPILLPRALQSVLGQTHANWHLYLVNDGGDPAPVDDLCRSLPLGDRVTIIHVPTSGGMEAASNKALAAADGDFITVHDDDDSWHPEFLERTAGFLRRSENLRYVAVAARPQIVDETITSDECVELGRRDWYFWTAGVDFTTILGRNYVPPICLLVRRDAIEKVGRFNERLPVLGDWDFIIRLLMIGDIATLPETLAHYHHRAGGSAQYGNSVVAGLNSHEVYDVLYRNHLVRQSLAKRPEDAALIGAVRRNVFQSRDDTQEVLWRAVERIEEGRSHWLEGLEGRLYGHIRSCQNDLQRVHVEIEQVFDLATELNRKLHWLSHEPSVVGAIAREVWFEKQRWGLAYKLRRWFRTVTGRGGA